MPCIKIRQQDFVIINLKFYPYTLFSLQQVMASQIWYVFIPVPLIPSPQGIFDVGWRWSYPMEHLGRKPLISFSCRITIISNSVMFNKLTFGPQNSFILKNLPSLFSLYCPKNQVTKRATKPLPFDFITVSGLISSTILSAVFFIIL